MRRFVGGAPVASRCWIRSMDRPPVRSNQPPPPRRRIVPVAVTQDEVENACNPRDFNQPLVVPPAPATGNSKDISKCGAGRRVFVNIDSKVEIKWKDVLRQQGLDITTWRKQRDQKLAQLEAGARAPGAAKRRDVTGLLAKKHQLLYEETDDSNDDFDEEDEGESGEADEPEGEEGDGAGSSGEHDEEEDDGEDDEDDEKEGNETGGEVDLEKEAETEQQQAKAKRKRQRFERYDDDFIDDSELETVKVAAQAKTKFSGFYVSQGGVETIEEAPKPRAKAKSRHPKTSDATAAAGTAAAGSGPGRKRKQPAQQQQDQQRQQQPEAAASAAPKKKRQRETPAGAAAAGSQDPTHPAGKKAKPSSTPPAADGAQAAAAAAGPTGNAAAEGLPIAPAAASGGSGGGTAKMAVAAALAAKKKKAPTDTAAAAAAPPLPAAGNAAAIQQPAPAATPDHSTPQPQPQQQPVPVEAALHPAGKSALELKAASAAAVVLAATAPTPTQAARLHSTPADAAEYKEVAGKEAARKADIANTEAAETAAAAAAGRAVEAARAAGLPQDVVAAVEALQHAVAEHKPAAPGTTSSAANMSKAVKKVLEALGVGFARQPEQVREQHSGRLIAVLGPLMLPYMKEKKLRRLVLEDPAKKAEELDTTKAALMAELDLMAGAPKEGQAGSGHDDDFQLQLSTAAEDALVAAWAAAKDVPEALSQLAVDVCSKLGCNKGSPDKAVSELLPVLKKAKRRLSKQKQPSQPASARQSPEPSTAAAAAAADTATTAAATAAATIGGSTAGPTPQQLEGSSPGAIKPYVLASIALAAAVPGRYGSVGAAAVNASQRQTQKQEKEQWSSFGAPSPRLQRCVAAAVEAGADQQWLRDKYATLKGSYMHQAFRTLCLSGPQGCPVAGFVARAAEHQLGFSGEDSTTVRRAAKQSLQTVTMTNIVGITEADPNAFALLCFPGVQQQPTKPSKAAADATGGQQGTQAAAE